MAQNQQLSHIVPTGIVASRGLKQLSADSNTLALQNRKLRDELHATRALVMDTQKRVDSLAEAVSALQYALKAVGDGIEASSSQTPPLAGYPTSNSPTDVTAKLQFIRQKIGVLLKYCVNLARGEVDAVNQADLDDPVPTVINETPINISTGKEVLAALNEDDED